MKQLFTISAAILLLSSCTAVKNFIRGEQSAHEAYAGKLDDKGLDKTPEGRAWLAASKIALEDAQAVELPYNHIGYFSPGKSRAVGLTFSARRGERINFIIQKKTGATLNLFADVFVAKAGSLQSVFSAGEAASSFYVDADEDGQYTLRLQPKLSESGEYMLIAAIGPSLEFPVEGAKAKPGSFWGADRDGGKRKHEGVDIFAPRGTPALAVSDGVIAGVREDVLGGKTVWLRPQGKNYTLYYAHLDEQLVREGQLVKKGDIIGKVGNTGNAITGSPHLHFGVYTPVGAVDPYPFINKDVKTAVAVSKKDLDKSLKLTKTKTLGTGEQLPLNTTVTPLAVHAKGYIVETPEGRLLTTSFTEVKTATTKDQPGMVTSERTSSKRSE